MGTRNVSEKGFGELLRFNVTKVNMGGRWWVLD